MEFTGENRGFCYIHDEDWRRSGGAEANGLEIQPGRPLGVSISVDNNRLFIGGSSRDRVVQYLVEQRAKRFRTKSKWKKSNYSTFRQASSQSSNFFVRINGVYWWSNSVSKLSNQTFGESLVLREHSEVSGNYFRFSGNYMSQNVVKTELTQKENGGVACTGHRSHF